MDPNGTQTMGVIAIWIILQNQIWKFLLWVKNKLIWFSRLPGELLRELRWMVDSKCLRCRRAWRRTLAVRIQSVRVARCRWRRAVLRLGTRLGRNHPRWWCPAVDRSPLQESTTRRRQSEPQLRSCTSVAILDSRFFLTPPPTQDNSIRSVWDCKTTRTESTASRVGWCTSNKASNKCADDCQSSARCHRRTDADRKRKKRKCTESKIKFWNRLKTFNGKSLKKFKSEFKFFATVKFC